MALAKGAIELSEREIMLLRMPSLSPLLLMISIGVRGDRLAGKRSAKANLQKAPYQNISVFAIKLNQPVRHRFLEFEATDDKDRQVA